jgi:cytochrome d ubiquinol oxidase subunit II
VAAGNLIAGLPLNERGEFTGSLIGLFGFYPLATGALALATFALHGVMFLFLKTAGSVRDKLSEWMWPAWGIFLVLYILVSMLTLIENPHVIAAVKQAPWAIPIVILNVVCVANMPRTIYRKKFGQAFISSCLNIVCLVALFSISTYPNLVFSTGTGDSLTLENAASSQGTLWIMTIIAVIGVPFILGYTAIIYWTFRHPIKM